MMEYILEILQFLAQPLLKLGKWILNTFGAEFVRKKNNSWTKKDPKEILEYRKKMKKEINEGFYNWHKAGNTRDEIIIRDVNRMDNYPDISSSKGIAPWFRVSFKDLYTRGIEVFLSMPITTHKENGVWKIAHDDKKDTLLVHEVGRIPFENIISIDWDGDEYYSYPHFYCSFTNKKEPYEDVVFCKICKTVDGNYYYPYLYNDDNSIAKPI